MVQKEIIDNNKSYNSFIKTPDLDLDKAIKFINLEQKSSFTKDLNVYKSSQETNSIQKNIDSNNNIERSDNNK